MLIEIPLSITLGATATVMSVPGVLHTWSWLTGGVAPDSSPSLVGPALALPAFLLATAIVAPDDLRETERPAPALGWASLVFVWGVFLTAGATGGFFQLHPTRWAHAGLALLLGALAVRYAGQVALALYRRRASRPFNLPPPADL